MKKTAKLFAFVLSAAIFATSASAVSYTTAKIGSLMAKERERLRDIPVEVHHSVTYYKDALHTEEYKDLSDVPADEYVYYNISTDDGYYVKWVYIRGEYMDTEKILFGDREPSYPDVTCSLRGDIDSSGKVGIGDMATLLRHMAVRYYDFSVEMVEADFNGDGKYNLSDCALLLKYIAGWNVDLEKTGDNTPEIYCDFDSGEVDSGWNLEKRRPFYVVSVIESVEGLEEYAVKSVENYGYDNTVEEYDTLIDGLKESYTEEFFEDNRLVLFDFADHVATGEIYVETVGNKIRIGVYNVRKTGVPFSGKILFHKNIVVPRDSGIDLDGDMYVFTRDGNTVGAKYLMRCVDKDVTGYEGVYKTVHYN